MPSTATCKHCRQPVTIPDSIDPAATVRCPLCDAEYRLSEVDGKSEEIEAGAATPELVVVSRDFSNSQQLASQTDDQALGFNPPGDQSPELPGGDDVEVADDVKVGDEIEAQVEVGDDVEVADDVELGDEEFRVRCPCCEAEYRLSQLVVVKTGKKLGEAAAGALASQASASEEAPAFSPWGQADSSPRIDVGFSPSEAVPGGAFNFGDEESDPEQDSVAARSRRRQERRGKHSILRLLFGWASSGFVGLLLAYYGLNWIKGEQGNFLKLPLPGIPHTYQYSPEWFPDWLQLNTGLEETAADEGDVAEAEFELPADFGESNVAGEPDEQPHQQPDESAAPVPEEPEKKTFPEGYVGLADPPSYTSDELGVALKKANESLEADGDSISDQTYGMLCQMAEKFTFLDSSRGSNQLSSRTSAVRKLIEKIGGNPANLDKIGFQAGGWCLNKNRQSNGVLLAGTVDKTISDDNAHGAHVQLAASGKTILIASHRPIRASADDSVMVLGSIVDNPAENLVGFETQQPFVVWAGTTIKIGQ